MTTVFWIGIALIVIAALIGTKAGRGFLAAIVDCLIEAIVGIFD